MKFKLIIFITLGLLSSCSMLSITKTDKNRKCRKLGKVIQENWMYNKGKRVYEIKDKQAFIEYRTCMYGMTRDEIINLLGKPTLEYGEKGYFRFLKYYTDASCHRRSPIHCSVCIVEIEKKTGKVAAVKLGAYTVN